MNNKSIQELLQQFPIFKDLTDYEMGPVLDIANHRLFRQGTHIFMQGDPLTNVYFIYSGSVKIYKTDQHGKEQIVNVLRPGDMFPHQRFVTQDNYHAHAEVIEDNVLIYIPIPAFENYLITHPEFCMKLFLILGYIIGDLQNRLEENILHNTYEQIIFLLLRLAKKPGTEINDNYVCLITHFANRELANMNGV